MPERPCIFCGEPVECDPDYPDNVRVVHPGCTIEAVVAECERKGIPVPDWVQALRILKSD